MKKRVLITGSSRGIGKAIAIDLAKAGFSITCHGRELSEALSSTSRELQDISESNNYLTFDVLDRALTKKLLEENISEFGAFYGVVLSAGITKDVPFPGMEDEDWDSVINIDLGGFYNVLRPIIMPMIQLRTGGRIISISSLSGVVGNRGQVNYSAAKAGLIGASKALSKELAKRRITVNCIAPGGIESDMLTDKVREELLKSIPMGRLGRVEEVSAAAKYLFSPEAEYMTGQTLILAGGIF